MDSFDLLRVLDQLAPSRALVLGDLIRDRYACGNAERTIQKAPIPVLHATDQVARLERAANVARMVSGLDETVTGAGDMVLATLGACLAGGATYETAICLANYAANLEVERAGVPLVGRGEIRDEPAQDRKPGGRKIATRDEAVSVSEQHRRCGRRIVFTNGCFDLLHLGHVTSLQQAASHGDVLIAGINSDSGVRRLKGEGRPVICQQDRAALLAALACVDHVIIFDEDTPRQLLHAIRPDVLVKGGTYADNEVIGHEVVKAYGGSVCVTAVVEGISTTQILKSLPLRTPQRSLRAA